MGPNEILTQADDKWHEFFKLLHESLQQVVEPEGDVDPKGVLTETLQKATALNDEFEAILDNLRNSLL